MKISLVSVITFNSLLKKNILISIVHHVTNSHRILLLLRLRVLFFAQRREVAIFLPIHLEQRNTLSWQEYANTGFARQDLPFFFPVNCL